MSTTTTTPMTKEERYANAIERAKNYPMFGDGLSSPVAVGNISNYIATNGDHRTIINLAAKTARCVGGPLENEHERPAPNAHVSQPADWNLKFQTGDYVCMLIQDGYVKKLLPATAMASKQISYNAKAVKATLQAQADGSVVDTETGEEVAKAKAGKPAKAAVAGKDDDGNDLPF